MDKKISVISDLDGKKIVVISDIRFKGKRNINWEEVEQYLKEYIGDCYEVVETSDQVYIGSDFPGELKGSGDTKRLYGANAKQRLMLLREFLCFFNVLRINDGRKTLKESIMLMQSLAAIDLRQGLHFQYITMILEILNGLIYSG